MSGAEGNETVARVAGVIVTYRPEASKLVALVKHLAEECSLVLIVDNGGGRAALAQDSEALRRSRYIDLGGNRGLGAALNEGFRLAAVAGCEFVTTFDQDSVPNVGQIDRLVTAHRELSRRGTAVGAIGPRIVDVRNARPLEHHFVRRHRGWPMGVRLESGVVETDFVISSGALISIETWRSVGGYDSALFVDYTDVEWCLRAADAGFRSFGLAAEVMRHEIGGDAAPGAFGLTLMRHAPLRRYYYARNALLLARRSYVAWGWKVRLVLGVGARIVLLPFLLRGEPAARRHWMRLMQGVWHGIRRIEGPFPHHAV